MKNQKISKENIIIISVAIILSIGIIVFAIFSNSNKTNISNVPGAYDKFAQCLADKGAIMYGSYSCPHCQAQKAAFGTSFQYIKYVECTDNAQLCVDKGIQNVPTWMVGSTTIEEGFDDSTMKKLSSATECPLPDLKTSSSTETIN